MAFNREAHSMSLKVFVTKMLRNKQAFLSGAGLPVTRPALTEARWPQHSGARGETPAPGERSVGLAASVLRRQQIQQRAEVPDSLGEPVQPAAM